MADGRHFKNRYIAISLGKKSADFDEILCTAADFELDVTRSKMKKLHWIDSEFDRMYFLFILFFFFLNFPLDSVL